MLVLKQKRKHRAYSRRWHGFAWALIFCGYSTAHAAWKENCQSSYEPLDIAPALPLALRQLETTRLPKAKGLEDRLRSHLLNQAQEPRPSWNDKTSQVLVREVQDFLFQEKPDTRLESLRVHGLLLMLAQRQWDVLEPALKKPTGTLTLWLQAETQLGLRHYPDALRLFQRPDTRSLQSWLSWRRMETRLLMGQSEASFEHLTQVLNSELISQPRVREKFQTFLQSFTAQKRALRPLLNLLQSKADADATGQAAFCILTTAVDPEDRRAALDALLNLKTPSSQSLRLASTHFESLLVEPAHVGSLLARLESLARHAEALLRQTGKDRPENALIFATTLQKAGNFLLDQVSLRASVGSLDRLQGIMQKSITVLSPYRDAQDLLQLQARILTVAHRYAEAARVYRVLALATKAPSQQRQFADLMLQNFGLAATDQATDPSFMDACRIYQKLVPDGRQELRRCDLMMARQALNQGLMVEARQALWQIVYAFPESIEGQTAAERLLELARQQPYELYMTTDKLLNIRSFQSGPWGIKLKDLRRQSSFQRIEQLASADDQAEAYFVFAQKEKGDPLASRSLLLAITLDQKAGRLARAMDRLETWLHDYPNSPEAPARLLNLISLAERTLQVPRARRYLQWTSAYRWTSEQTDQIQLKSCLFDILEQPVLALGSCEKLGAHLTQGTTLRLKLARALAFGAYNSELYSYAKDSLLPREDLSVDQKMLILDLLRRTSHLTPKRDDDIRTIMTNYYLEQADSLGPESRRLLGGLAYQEAQKTLAAFQALPIYGTRSDELISSIQAKKQAYDELEALYNKVLQTKDPHWGSSALCDLALAAENFAEALQKLPEIEGLDRKRIMSQIASQLASWRAKAKTMSGSASKTLERFGTLHADNPRIIQEAQRLKDDVIRFHDWIPALLDGENTASHKAKWSRWDEVVADFLTASQRHAGEPPVELVMEAINFALAKRDFIRAEWLNEQLLQSPQPERQALGAWQQGRLQARLDQFGKAEESWRKALELDPNLHEVHKQLGLLYARFGLFAKALPWLKPLEKDPQLAWTLVAIERQLGLNELADDRCEGLTSSPKATAEAFYNCALLEFQNHRNANRAITWMEQALRAAESTPTLAAAARQQLALMQIWKARFQADR